MIITINPTGWLLIGLVIFFALCFLAIIAGHMISTTWPDADQPVYRTADGKAIAEQTAGLQSMKEVFDIRQAATNACEQDCVNRAAKP